MAMLVAVDGPRLVGVMAYVTCRPGATTCGPAIVVLTSATCMAVTTAIAAGAVPSLLAALLSADVAVVEAMPVIVPDAGTVIRIVRVTELPGVSVAVDPYVAVPVPPAPGVKVPLLERLIPVNTLPELLLSAKNGATTVASCEPMFV